MEEIKKLNQEIQAYKDLIYKLINLEEVRERVKKWKDEDFKRVLEYNEGVERTTDIGTFFAHLLDE